MLDKNVSPAVGKFYFFRDNLVVVTLFFVILGYYDQHDFYKYFGISIYPYLETSEMIFAFSNVLSIGILQITPILFLLLFADAIYNSPFRKENSTTHSASDNRRINLKTLKIIVIIMLIVYIGVAIMMGVLYISYRVSELDLFFFYTNVFCVVTMSLLLWDTVRKLKCLDKGVPLVGINIHFITVTSIGCFLLFIVTKNYIASSNIIQGNPKSTISFRYDSTVIESSNARPYIGSTRGYIFLYDTTKRIVQIFPERDIKYVSIKKNREGL